MAARPLLICLMGPTASGKTDLAIQLAATHNCELVNVDSAQVYRGLDIGSAKSDYPHHLIDIRDPAQPYSVAEFCDDAQSAMISISAAGKTPLLVGGTMMYFKALIEGLADMPASEPGLRQHLEQEAKEKGWPHLHRMLEEVDPDSAARIHPNHSHRIGRALEVYLSSGVTMTAWRRKQAHKKRGSIIDAYQVVQMAISPLDRAVLHARIEQRVDAMLEQGFAEEVRALYERGDLSLDLPSMRAAGYRQMWAYTRGEYDLKRARQRCVEVTRQLAKRQLTWLRKWPGLNWIYTDANGAAASTAQGLEEMPQTPLAVALKYLEAATI
jgi:tRNA dimethylallyltransferase